MWGYCTAQCGVNGNKGIQKKHFIEFIQAQHGGDECQLGDVETSKSEELGTTYQTQECVKPEHECPKCIGYWSQWSKCSKLCGTGKKTRTFTIHREAVGGKACDNAQDDIQEEFCNTEPCPTGYVCPPGEECGDSAY